MHGKIYLRYTLDNEEIKIVSLNSETIGEKGTIVNCFFIFENKKLKIEQKSDSELQKGDKVFLKKT